MKNFFFVFIGTIILTACNTLPKDVETRQRIKLDRDWRFHLSDLQNAEKSDFQDKEWRNIELPHDWSIEGEYDTIHGTDWQSGFLPAGIGWYRKSFDWEENWKGKKINIQFDGVYMNSTVWINGQLLGERPYGYISYWYDLTPYLKKGSNVIAVKVDHSKPLSGRWYTGSGIYRNVWLEVTNPIHVKHWGAFVTTPEVEKSFARINAITEIINESSNLETISLETKLVDKTGRVMATTTSSQNIEKGETVKFEQSLEIKKPELWSPENPYLYEVVNTVKKGNTLLDTFQTPLGIRKLEFSAKEGFKLNDVSTKFKGVCLHHAAGAVGAAVPNDVLYRRLKLLKDMGTNAIRTAHNPFSPDFYAMCDTLGIMVMNEIFDGWEVEKATDDYGNYFEDWWQKDATDFILRDRNHPSVVMWSIGNEVRKPTAETQKKLVDLFHELDPTRPVTQGGESPSRDQEDEIVNFLDIKGFNGSGERVGVYEDYHENNPGIPIIGTEVPHTYQTRGVYRTKTHWRRRDFPAPWERSQGGIMSEGVFPIMDLAENEVFAEEKNDTYYKNGKEFPIENKEPWTSSLYYQSSYDNASVRTSARKAWQMVKDLDYVMGHFRWTGIDYLGETNKWPSRMANFGVMDICGFPKDHYYLYQSLWTEKPMVHILPHWTHPGKEGVEIPVVIYTNADEVELFVNGKTLGKKPYLDEQLVWMVPYEPGAIKAIASRDGKEVASKEYNTAGKPKILRVKTDRVKIGYNTNEVAHLEVEILDENGNLVPDSSNMVTFSVEGPGKLIAVDNGDPLDLSSYSADKRRAFKGKCLGIIKSTDVQGKIKVILTSPGLKSEVIEVHIK